MTAERTREYTEELKARLDLIPVYNLFPDFYDIVGSEDSGAMFKAYLDYAVNDNKDEHAVTNKISRIMLEAMCVMYDQYKQITAQEIQIEKLTEELEDLENLAEDNLRLKKAKAYYRHFIREDASKLKAIIEKLDNPKSKQNNKKELSDLHAALVQLGEITWEKMDRILLT